MAEFRSRVIALSRAAWSLRQASPRPSTLPFALALFTDPKRTPHIERLVTDLPRGLPPVAVIFRHDALPEKDRFALADAVRDEVQRRGHFFLMARARLPGADGTHASRHRGCFQTAPAHSLAEGMRAVHHGSDALFVSPVLSTASHPGEPFLGLGRAMRLAASLPRPCLALGGIDERTARTLHGSMFQGFGAIGAFLRKP
ncbi:MAG: thiamine phosphate synthase [Pseudomonadota bacterium]